MSKKIFCLFLLIAICSFFIPHSSFFIINCYSQDRPPATPPPLPFQQQAGETNDEQLGMQYFQNRDYEKAVEVYARVFEKNHPTTFILII